MLTVGVPHHSPRRPRLVERIVEPGPPITSTYRLTAAGEQLRPALEELCSWAERWDRALNAS